MSAEARFRGSLGRRRSVRGARLLVAALACVACVACVSACGSETRPPAPEAADTVERRAPAAPAVAAAPDTTPLADPCIRGGTPRANVSRIMGEPDSVVYGSWFYGQSEVLFGYGVVVEIRDRGELVLCDPA